MIDEEAARQDANGATPPADDNVEFDEHWQYLLDKGLVKGSPPRKEDRADPNKMRPIRYHGTNDDLMRDLSRIR